MTKPNIFFFDVDGTLVNPNDHSVPASAIYALQELKHNDQLICICTGRSLEALEHVGFDTIADWDYYICCNGQVTYDHNKKCIHSIPIPKEIVLACIEKANQLNSPLVIQGEKTIITKEANIHVKTASEFFNEPIPPLDTYDGFDVYMMMAYGERNYDYHDYTQISELCFIPGQSTYADIVLKGVNKYSAIQALLTQLALSSYIAFGDSLNDLEMLAHAKVAVVLGNGCKEAKQYADIITDSVGNDGIYHALVNMHHIPANALFERSKNHEESI